VFVLPRNLSLGSTTTTQLVSGVMFAWSSLSIVLSSAPAYMRSAHALAEIEALEKKLDAGAAPAVEGALATDPWHGRFSRLEVSQLQYTYAARPGTGTPFHVGPVDLTLQPGEVLFIVGGNGSGKSTFVKALTGLYQASSGTLRVDGVPVTPQTAEAYRALFCAIFSDFHLFSRLYGLLQVEPATVQALLSQMGLSSQTSFAQQAFTRRDLSTGQRKRLALVVALLEDRPLYVFDEWAADQDPEFRHYFYMELLPLLRSRGKTVIAVSHDDRYFSCADRLLSLDYGRVRSIEHPPAGSSRPVPTQTAP
jgi:putative pyoverdin transport system ATP-binding/permease protein